MLIPVLISSKLKGWSEFCWEQYVFKSPFSIFPTLLSEKFVLVWSWRSTETFSGSTCHNLFNRSQLLNCSNFRLKKVLWYYSIKICFSGQHSSPVLFLLCTNGKTPNRTVILQNEHHLLLQSLQSSEQARMDLTVVLLMVNLSRSQRQHILIMKLEEFH